VSETPDRERDPLQEIERDLAAEDPRLARLLAHPGWLRIWRWGTHRDTLTALIAIIALSLIPIIIALTQ
jgi:Protein of unknown function (DUF3040)